MAGNPDLKDCFRNGWAPGFRCQGVDRWRAVESAKFTIVLLLLCKVKEIVDGLGLELFMRKKCTNIFDFFYYIYLNLIAVIKCNLQAPLGRLSL